MSLSPHPPRAHDAAAGIAAVVVAGGMLGGCSIDFDAPFADTSNASDAGADARLDSLADVHGEDGADASLDALSDVSGDATTDADALADAPEDTADACPPSTKPCEGACVSTNDPKYGCANPLDPQDPCSPCPTPSHGSSLCLAGACGASCNPGWGNCDQSLATGCETDLTTVMNCGSCGNVCSGGSELAVCVAGKCDVLLPTWTYTHWRLDQFEGNGCGEWGKVTEVRFTVDGAQQVNTATSYTNGTVGDQPIVDIVTSGDSQGYGPAWKAFDGSGGAWQSVLDSSYYWQGSEYLIVRVTSPIAAELVRVGGFWGSTNCLRLSGSNNGTTWVVLGTECNSDCNSILEFKP